MNELLLDYLPLVIFIAVALAIVLALLIVPFMVAYKAPDPEKLSAYECGFNAFDDARMKFDVRFYLVAILFIIFDLEVTFLFPWAVAFGKLGATVDEISVPIHLAAPAIWLPIAAEGATEFMMKGNGMGTNWRGLYNTTLLDAHSAWRHRAEMHAAVIGRLKTGQYVHERRLAGAVRPDQPKDLVAPHRKVDVLQRGNPFEGD